MRVRRAGAPRDAEKDRRESATALLDRGAERFTGGRQAAGVEAARRGRRLPASASS